ncbi:hypothetical protein RJG79_07465 [Mycoplasmatota bacterium WC44]
MNYYNQDYNYDMKLISRSNNIESIYYPHNMYRVYFPNCTRSTGIDDKEESINEEQNSKDNINNGGPEKRINNSHINSDKTNLKSTNDETTHKRNASRESKDENNDDNKQRANKSNSNEKSKSFTKEQLYKQLYAQYPNLTIKEYVTIFGILTGSLKVAGVLVTTDKIIQVILRGSIDFCPPSKRKHQEKGQTQDQMNKKKAEEVDLETLSQLMQTGGLSQLF